MGRRRDGLLGAACRRILIERPAYHCELSKTRIVVWETLAAIMSAGQCLKRGFLRLLSRFEFCVPDSTSAERPLAIPRGPDWPEIAATAPKPSTKRARERGRLGVAAGTAL